MRDKRSSSNSQYLVAVRNDRGMALILVLICLLLLSILGVTVLTSATSDLRITGNYRKLDDAFYAAESAMEFAQADGIIYSTLLPATSTHWPVPGAGVVINSDGSMSTTTHTDYPDYNKMTLPPNGSPNTDVAYIKVDYLSTGAVPSGLGTEVDAGLGSGTGFKANFYVVNVIGTTQDAANNELSHVELESHIVRVVPK
jgi:Tfp pilus assembly protein PilX